MSWLLCDEWVIILIFMKVSKVQQPPRNWKPVIIVSLNSVLLFRHGYLPVATSEQKPKKANLAFKFIHCPHKTTKPTTLGSHCFLWIPFTPKCLTRVLTMFNWIISAINKTFVFFHFRGFCFLLLFETPTLLTRNLTFVWGSSLNSMEQGFLLPDFTLPSNWKDHPQTKVSFFFCSLTHSLTQFLQFSAVY